MDYENELRFLQRLLGRLNVQMLRFAPDSPPEVDLGLRRLAGLPPFPAVSGFEPQTVYLATDGLACRYAGALLPGGAEALLLGPYLEGEMRDEAIIPLLDRLRLPPRLLPALRRYYCSLAQLRDGVMEAIVTALGEALFGGPDAFSLQHLDLAAAPVAEPAVVQSTEPFEARLLEERYAYEGRLLRAVSLGRTQEALRLVAMAGSSAMESRTPDPLRNFKNYAIIMNTLLRKAAEKAVVHPVYLDEISHHYAVQIEASTSCLQLENLRIEMVRKYCILVQNQSLKNYPPLIRDLLNHINLNLSSDLSLKSLSQMFSVNASYLSSLFRREMTMTLTDYVNGRRIDTALKLLNTTDIQIQDIAYYVGIEDVNYFTRIFKKKIGVSPTEYKKSIRPA